MKRSTPLKATEAPLRRTPMKRGSAIKPFSKKRAGERDQRQKVIEETMRRSGGRCQAADLVPEVKCWGPLDTDEVVGRGVYPGAHLDADNTQTLCRAHHTWKHEHPRLAAERGLRRASWQRG